MKLPFLKNKRPRSAKDQPTHNLKDEDMSMLEDHCVNELMASIESKDVKAFRAAIEALVHDCFEDVEAKEHLNGPNAK